MHSTNKKSQNGESDANKNANISDGRSSPTLEGKFHGVETVEDSRMAEDLNNLNGIKSVDMSNDESLDQATNSSHNYLCTTYSNEDRLYSCNLCDFKSISKMPVRSHIRAHPDFRAFPCTICNYKGKSKDNLRVHLLSHSERRAYSCSICDYKGKSKDRLNKHMVIHTDVYPYKCHLCDYKARRNQSFKRHIMLHNEEKPHGCTYCSFSRGAISDFHQGWPAMAPPIFQSQKLKEKCTATIYSTGVY